MCINLMSCSASCLLISSSINFRIAIYSFLNKLIWLMNTISNLNLDNFLSIKSIHRNLCISCYNDTLCILNIIICKYILSTARSSCLNFDRNTVLLAGLFQSFSSHISMCNTCWTSCYCEYIVSVSANFLDCLSAFSLVDNSQKLFWSLCSFKCCYKLWSHQ